MFGGWGIVAEKMTRFTSDSSYGKKNEPKSYKEATEILPWPDLVKCRKVAGYCPDIDFEVQENSCLGALAFLDRCLVGRVGNLDCHIPSRSEQHRWVDLGWKTARGVRAVDMNEKNFLFEFPSKVEASRIFLEKDWVFKGNSLCLDR